VISLLTTHQHILGHLASALQRTVNVVYFTIFSGVTMRLVSTDAVTDGVTLFFSSKK